MNTYSAALLAELGSHVTALGKEGGKISPSLYDTAQVIRFYPPPEGPRPALDWLLTQQQADGGWGNPNAPYARPVPTLATLLALYPYQQERPFRTAVEAGLEFLQCQTTHWQTVPIDALPIATEMILPHLLEEANAIGLPIPCTPYRALYAIRDKKRQKLQKRALTTGTPPTYSWEALGQAVYPPLIDQSGGIGHSPSATAAWLHQAQHQADLATACQSARIYLQKATAATSTGIPGVVPNVWPITGFELSYGLYALVITGLFHHPLLAEAIQAPMDHLQTMMERGQGISFGEYFTPDVDETAVGMAALQAGGRPVDPAVIFQFKNEEHFYTFPNELNPSVFSNAHALYALWSIGARSHETESFLIERQCDDGRWLADKWHSSWLYTTLEVLLTLDGLGYTAEIQQALDALINTQKADGGWGSGAHSTQAETGHALIALQASRRHGMRTDDVTLALARGQQWLQHRPTFAATPDEQLWLGKELYSPYRVDEIYHLGALYLSSLSPDEVLR
ncbi:MAG: hypothetical protein KF832_19140 [Caldilineaceae bacterium]|nr:hypothetical protein [Caldilineaceae bacterium]